MKLGVNLLEGFNHRVSPLEMRGKVPSHRCEKWAVSFVSSASFVDTQISGFIKIQISPPQFAM